MVFQSYQVTRHPPKLHIADSGLLCALLGVWSSQDFAAAPPLPKPSGKLLAFLNCAGCSSTQDASASCFSAANENGKWTLSFIMEAA